MLQYSHHEGVRIITLQTRVKNLFFGDIFPQILMPVDFKEIWRKNEFGNAPVGCQLRVCQTPPLFSRREFASLRHKISTELW